MNVYRLEVTGNGAWQQKAIPFNARFIYFRHVVGAADISVSFNGATSAHRIFSPTAGKYAQEATMEIEAGLSQYGVNVAAGNTIEVVAWR